jgi:hypothetical protein
MRRTIETAPRDGNVIILEDDARGTYDVAHWSPEAGEWVGENGEPSKITPSHWYPMPRDKYLSLESDGSSNPSQVRPAPVEAKHTPHARWGFAASSIAAILVVAALNIGIYAGQQHISRVRAMATQVVEQETPSPSRDSRKTLLALQEQAEADQARMQAAEQEPAQVKQTVETSAPEARQSLEKEQRLEVLANELAGARRAIDGLNLQLRTEAAKTAQLLEQEREKTAALVQEATAARQELTASTAEDRHALEEERARGAALASELATARGEIEMQAALLRKAGDEGLQLKQAADSTTAELQQARDRVEVSSHELKITRREVEATAALLNKSRDDAASFKQTAEKTMAELQQERDRAEASSRELKIARREIDSSAALLNKARDDAAQFKQTAESKTAELQQERDRAAESSRELEIARREIETNVALNKARDYAAQFKQIGEKTTAELQQSLQREHDRAEALANELASARRDVETQVALSSKKGDEAAQLKQAAESATAELRQSLQQEHDKAEALASKLASARQEALAADLESMRRTIDGRAAPERAANSQIVQVKQAAEAAASEQPAPEVSQGDPEAAKLMVRARALLGQGNIGAARVVLERAAETGSAQARFMLAETYDPFILSAWGTYGTRGEATKAREFYAKAHAGGIQEAKDRFNALR